MFAVSQVDSKKVGRFTESFKDALEWQVFQEKGGAGTGHKGAPNLTPFKPPIPLLGDRESESRFQEHKDSIKQGLAKRLLKRVWSIDAL